MTIVLTYTTEDGIQEQVELSETVYEIDLEDRKISTIDLQPLSICTNLQYLSLSNNQIERIDFSPLSSCVNLQELILGGILGKNQLQSIDLIPLGSCVNLEKLILSNNQLQSVDLTPLASCSNLQTLSLSVNQLQSIDLSPLASCSKLERLSLANNQFTSLDLKPLTSCSNLQELILGENQLQFINLAPLASLSKLQSLNLSGTYIQSIDLCPLTTCTNLEALDISWNKLQSIDLAPLASCSNLQILKLDSTYLECIDLHTLGPQTNLKALILDTSLIHGNSILSTFDGPRNFLAADVTETSSSSSTILFHWEKLDPRFLQIFVRNPGASLKELSKKAGWTHAKTHRAYKSLSDSRIIQTTGFLDIDLLGLQRVLIIIENPRQVLTGPSVHKTLFIDGSPQVVLISALIPSSLQSDLVSLIASLRTPTTNVTAFSLSAGDPDFNGSNYSSTLDIANFQQLLQTRKQQPIQKSSTQTMRRSISSSRVPSFTYADSRVADQLFDSLDSVSIPYGFASSTFFSKRRSLLKNGLILPRSRINIPFLSERAVMICSARAARSIIPIWQELPLTYIAQIQNLEAKSDKRVIFCAALPSGLADPLVNLMNSSRIKSVTAWSINAGVSKRQSVSVMHGRRKQWADDINILFQVDAYANVRNQASLTNMPLDLS